MQGEDMEEETPMPTKDDIYFVTYTENYIY